MQLQAVRGSPAAGGSGEGAGGGSEDLSASVSRQQNGDCFFPVFTDIWELQKYAQGKKNLRPVQVPFPEIQKFWVRDAKAYIINPMGSSIPVTKEMISRILERFS